MGWIAAGIIVGLGWLISRMAGWSGWIGMIQLIYVFESVGSVNVLPWAGDSKVRGLTFLPFAMLFEGNNYRLFGN